MPIKRKFEVRIIKHPQTGAFHIELGVLGQVLRSPPFPSRDRASEFKQALSDFFKGTRW